MGRDAHARELRRETKRTLGHHLERFKEEERQRLTNLEARAEFFSGRIGAHETTLLGIQRDLHAFRQRGLFGRLKWLLVGA